MKLLKNKVEKVLREVSESRESDHKLMYHVLKLQGVNPDTITATELLRLMYFDKISCFESVRRSRQKLQELHPELRGKNYNARQKEQDSVKGQLSSMG